jgi:type I restriction enzyme, S subunit
MKSIDWTRRRLDELGFVGRGKSKHRPRNDPSLYSGPYPFIQTADIMAADPYITTYSQTYSETGLRQSKMWPSNTLCMTIAGANTAKVAILKIEACFPDSVIGFIPDKSKADLHFVMYSLGIMKDQFLAVSRGATQDNLGLNKLLSFPLLVPDVHEQRRIAGILSAYDELIENNKRRIALLEKMAEEIYREWFVRLRFPGHEKVKLVKGVPEGWEVRKFSDVYNIAYGRTLPTTKLIPHGKYEVYGAGDVIGFFNSYNCKERVALITCRGNGSGTVWHTKSSPSFVTNNSFMITPKHDQPQPHYYFIYLHMRNSPIEQSLGGSAQPQITIDSLSKVKIFKYPNELVERFSDIISSFDAQRINLHSEIIILEKSRDLLLPRLISGKLSIENLDIQFPPSMAEEAEAIA